MKKLLKTDRTARLVKVGQHRQRKASPSFTFSISRRRCGKKAMIPARITCSGQDTGWFTTGMTAEWDAISAHDFSVIGDESKTAILSDLRARAERMYADCRVAGRVVDVFAIRDALFGADALVAATPNVKAMIDLWLAYDQDRKDTEQIVERTRWKNARWTNDFWAFILKKHGPNAQLDKLKPGDIREFVIWLRQKRHLSNNVAQATASHAKVLMNYALDNEWIERNPFINFRRKMDTVERETLTTEEIKLFCTFQLASPALDSVRAMFFFMLLTGLSYADVQRLKADDIREQDGTKYIHLRRRKMLSRKNTVPALIPLVGPALNILLVYGSTLKDEPLLSLQANAPFNRSLQQIASMCGLKKSISTKVARNSLATYLLNEGVPLTSVSAILGHSSTLVTQQSYAKISVARVIADMNDLDKRLEGAGLYGISMDTKPN